MSWSGSNEASASSVKAFGLFTIQFTACSLCTAEGHISGSIKMERMFVHFTPLCAALIVSPLDAPSTLTVLFFVRMERSLGRNSSATFLNANVGPYPK